MKNKFLIKSVSLFLCAAMLLPGTVSASAADKEKYNGKVLMAVNTDCDFDTAKDGFYTFETSGSDRSEKMQGNKSAARKAAFDVTGSNAVASPEEYREYLKTHKDEPQGLIHNHYKVGDTKEIYADMADGQGNTVIDFRCVAEGKDCTVWTKVFEDGSLYDTEEDAKETADFFDSVHKAEEEVFGKNIIDTDGDGRFAILSYDIADAGGFFSYSDLSDVFGFVGNVYAPLFGMAGNHMDCVYVCGLPDKSTVVHEYQHYLFRCNEFAGKTNFNYIEGEESFVTEGFSRCAEIIFADGSFYITSAMERADEVSLIYWAFDYDCYEISGAFCNYLRNRYAVLTGDKSKEFPGKGFYLEYHGRRNRENRYKSVEVFADILYPADKYPELKTGEERAKQLLIDFWKAVYLREQTGIYGFNGEEKVEGFCWESALPLRTEFLKPGMAKFYVIDSGKKADEVLKNRSKNIYFETFDIEKNTGTEEPVFTFNLNFDSAPEPCRLSAFWYPGPVFKGNADIDGYNGEGYDVYGNELFPYKRPGYNFLGWSEDRNAVKADYLREDIIEAKKDSVFYAVWEKMPVIETDKEYDESIFEGLSESEALFIPEESGYYLLRSTLGFYLEDPCSDSVVELIYTEENEENGESELICIYKLTGGGEYTFVSASDSPGLSFCVTETGPGFKLSFVSGDGYGDVGPYVGRTDYILPGLYREPIAYPESRFAGWALKKDAAEPDYLEGERITITRDTSLYPVFKAREIARADGEYEFDDYLFFIPESDGTYEILFDDTSGVEILDEKSNPIGFLDIVPLASEEPFKGAFAGGHRYCFDTYEDSSKAKIRRISSVTDTSLTLYGFDDNEVYTDSGKPFYTIPDIELVENYSGGIAWDGIYYPGDTVFVLNSEEFHPKVKNCYPGRDYGPEDTVFNKEKNCRVAALNIFESGIFRIKASGGLAYYEESEDGEDTTLYRNTDEGCYILIKEWDFDKLIMFDEEITGFTVEKVSGSFTVTYSAQGCDNVPEPFEGFIVSAVPEEVPESQGKIFDGWYHEYTFRGEKVADYYYPGDRVLMCSDITLTADMQSNTFFDRLFRSFRDFINDKLEPLRLSFELLKEIIIIIIETFREE